MEYKCLIRATFKPLQEGRPREKISLIVSASLKSVCFIKVLHKTECDMLVKFDLINLFRNLQVAKTPFGLIKVY